MKRQTRKQSLIEQCVSTGIGYLVALATQIAVFPIFNLHVEWHENIVISLIFTGVSIIRGYAVRRFFNYWNHRGDL